MIYKTKEETEDWLNKMNVEKYIINDDLTVDVYGDVSLESKSRLGMITEIKVKFNKVYGDFKCFGNYLKSCEGFHEEVTGSLICSYNEITSLKYCTQKIGDRFSCAVNKLTTLKYSPKVLNGSFLCHGNQLTSLRYMPKVLSGHIDCSNNKITSFKYFQKEFNGILTCNSNQLSSLEGLPIPVSKIKNYSNNLLPDFIENMNSKEIDDYYNNLNLNIRLRAELPENKVVKRLKM